VYIYIYIYIYICTNTHTHVHIYGRREGGTEGVPLYLRLCAWNLTPVYKRKTQLFRFQQVRVLSNCSECDRFKKHFTRTFYLYRTFNLPECETRQCSVLHAKKRIILGGPIQKLKEALYTPINNRIPCVFFMVSQTEQLYNELC